MRPISQTCCLGILGVLASLCGCQVVEYHPPEPVTTTQIINMSTEGRSAAEIIEAIETSQTIYEMDSADVLDLHEKGVSREVIDHMLKTEQRHLRRRYNSSPYYYYPYGYHYYYPRPYVYGAWCW